MTTFCDFDDFLKTKKDARRPYDHFGGGIAPRSLLCVRKRRFPFLKKDLILSVIWSVICPRTLLPGKCPSDTTSTCAGGQDDVSSQVNSLNLIQSFFVFLSVHSNGVGCF